MAGARSTVKKPPKKVFKRAGSPSQPEKALVAQFVLDQPRELTNGQISGLARTLRRSKDVVKKLIDEARDNFVANAGRYVDIHIAATEGALSEGDHEVAAKAAQWAMEHTSAEGSRIVEKAQTGPVGSRIQIGIKVGGIDAPPAVGVVVNE